MKNHPRYSKPRLSPEERIQAAYFRFIMRLSEHEISVILNTNQGRVCTACKAVWDAVQDPEATIPVEEASAKIEVQRLLEAP